MTFVKLIPEIQLLVIFNRQTKEARCYPLPPGTTKSLSAEFQDAVLHLEAGDPLPFPLRLIEPAPGPA